jgi:16S rRNA (adenine(1408)-N(1))-methyltransferase
MDSTEFHARLANYNRITLDLGTGDGKFAFCHAENFPNHFVIGLDSCRENLHEFSRTKLPNLLYIIASAQSLPYELHGRVSHITINFPWGSLLGSLLAGDTQFIHGLACIAQRSAILDVRLNGGALAEQGWRLEEGAERVHGNLAAAGWKISPPKLMASRALRNFPSTWAKRLAFGRDPRAVEMRGAFDT